MNSLVFWFLCKTEFSMAHCCTEVILNCSYSSWSHRAFASCQSTNWIVLTGASYSGGKKLFYFIVKLWLGVISQEGSTNVLIKRKNRMFIALERWEEPILNLLAFLFCFSVIPHGWQLDDKIMPSACKKIRIFFVCLIRQVEVFLIHNHLPKNHVKFGF